VTNSNQQPDQEQSLPVISVQDIARQPQWSSGSLSYEDPLDKKHRLEQEASEAKHKRDQELAEAKHKRWRSTTLFAVTLIGLGFVFWMCLRMLGNPQASQDDKKWATALITSIVSGSVGYITGKAIA
jgi:hypothetical protein